MKTSEPNLSDREILSLIEKDQTSEKQTVVIAHEFRDIEQFAPADLLDELSAAGDMLEQMAWKIGWLTDELYRTLEANGRPKNYMLICYYVAVSKLRGQRSMNTVKKWALTARFYSPKLARQYHYDVLPFNTFSYAMSWGNEKTEDGGTKYMWQSVLDYAWLGYQNSGIGKAPSVRELKEHFESDPGQPAKEKKVTAVFRPSVPPMSAGLHDPLPAGGDDDDDDEMTNFVNALHIIKSGLPKVSQKFPVAAKVLSGISVQLDRVASYLSSGKDVEEQ